MNKLLIVLMTYFCLINCIKEEITAESECGKNSKARRTIMLSVKSTKSPTGEWVDRFSARAENSNSSSNVTLDVAHSVTECDGKRIIHIQGVANHSHVEGTRDKLLFHPKCGTNVAILNNGRTAQKINLEIPGNSIAFTNRPLKNNEIFEVRLDKKNTKFSYSLGFGISTKSPADIEITEYMWSSPTAWMQHHDIIYNNRADILRPYGRNLNGLEVGDRVGVMRSEYGTVHFFVNGVDQGPAVSNVPFPVFGVLDLYYNAAKATIVEESSLSLS